MTNTERQDLYTEVNELLKLVKESNDEELINKVQEKLEKTHAELTALVESAAAATKEFGDLNEMVENTKKKRKINICDNPLRRDNALRKD